jgi:hypothetical protein
VGGSGSTRKFGFLALASSTLKLTLTHTTVQSKHYDTTKEIRTLGTSHYRFSHNSAEREKEMAALKAARDQTLRERKATEDKKESRKRALEERRALLLEKKKRKMKTPVASSTDLTEQTLEEPNQLPTMDDDVSGFLESLS